MPPKRTKYRKSMKIHTKVKFSANSSSLNFGTVGIKVLKSGILTEKQIEAARSVVNRYAKKTGTTYQRIFADRPITKKPLEVRMGGGKGGVDHYSSAVKPGKIIFETSGLSVEEATYALKACSHKLSIKKAKVIVRKFSY